MALPLFDVGHGGGVASAILDRLPVVCGSAEDDTVSLGWLMTSADHEYGLIS